jgi:hypothetical protein
MMQQLPNSFQKWAQDYARAYGFQVDLTGNWVSLYINKHSIECMSTRGVQEACANIEWYKQ